MEDPAGMQGAKPGGATSHGKTPMKRTISIAAVTAFSLAALPAAAEAPPTSSSSAPTPSVVTPVPGAPITTTTSADTSTTDTTAGPTVAAFLVAHGVQQSRVHAEGKGEANPIADNKTVEGRSNNRRVEIVLVNATTEPAR